MFFCYTVAMRDDLCKAYDKLYCFLGYADMRLILGYESGDKGCARISFYRRGVPPPFSFDAPRPLHLQSLKSQLHVVQCTIPPRPLLPPSSVTGALCRKTDPKIATAPKTQSRSKDQNKDKDNSK